MTCGVCIYPSLDGVTTSIFIRGMKAISIGKNGHNLTRTRDGAGGGRTVQN